MKTTLPPLTNSIIQRAVLNELFSGIDGGIPFVLSKEKEELPILVFLTDKGFNCSGKEKRNAVSEDDIKQLLEDGWAPLRVFPLAYNEQLDYRTQIVNDFKDGRSYVIDQFNGMWATVSGDDNNVSIVPLNNEEKARVFYVHGNKTHKTELLRVPTGKDGITITMDEFCTVLKYMLKDSSNVELLYNTKYSATERRVTDGKKILQNLLSFAEEINDNGVILEFLLQGSVYGDTLELRSQTNWAGSASSVYVTYMQNKKFQYTSSAWKRTPHEDNGESLLELLFEGYRASRVFPLIVPDKAIWSKTLRDACKDSRVYEVWQSPCFLHVQVACDDEGATITVIEDSPNANSFYRNGDSLDIIKSFPTDKATRYNISQLTAFFDELFNDLSFIEVCTPTSVTQLCAQPRPRSQESASFYRFTQNAQEAAEVFDQFKINLTKSKGYRSLLPLPQEALYEFTTSPVTINTVISMRNRFSGDVVHVKRQPASFTYITPDVDVCVKEDTGAFLLQLLATEYVPMTVFPRREVSAMELLSFLLDVATSTEGKQWHIYLPRVNSSVYVEFRQGDIAILADPDYWEVSVVANGTILYKFKQAEPVVMNYYDFGDFILHCRKHTGAVVEWSYGQTIDEMLQALNSLG